MCVAARHRQEEAQHNVERTSVENITFYSISTLVPEIPAVPRLVCGVSKVNVWAMSSLLQGKAVKPYARATESEALGGVL